MKLLRGALQLVGLRFLEQEIVLAVVAFLLFAVWLRVPDGTSFAVAVSFVLAVVMLGVAFAGQAWLVLRLRGLPITRHAVVRGGVALLMAMALLYPLSLLLAHASAGDALRAGYYNSRFPASLRNTFSYAHIMTMLAQTWDSLFWAGLIVFTMGAVAFTAAMRPLAAFGRMVGSVTAWVVLTLATIVGSEATLRLMYWPPRHGLRVQVASLLLRVAILVVVNAWLVCLSLALLVVICRESDVGLVGGPHEKRGTAT